MHKARLIPIDARLWFLVPALAFLLTPFNAEAKKSRVAAGEIGPVAQFSLSGGVFTNELQLELRLPDTLPAAKILYTLDGSTPTTHSPTYTHTLTLVRPTLLRTRVLNGAALGPIRSEHYTILDSDLAGFNSNLPLVILDSCGPEFSRDVKKSAFLRLLQRSKDRASWQSLSENAGRALVNVRGRASMRYPKRSYTVKLTDEEGEDRIDALEGMPPDEDWILYAPYPDKTMMRDVLAYEMSRAMGHWAPRTTWVEVFVTDGKQKLGKSDYMGVYVLEERLKRNSGRVKIERLMPQHTDEPDVTGGYILKKDHVDRGFFGQPDLLGGQNFTSSGNRPGFPTPPGGFPADPTGFLPTYNGPRENSESSNSSSRRTSRTSRNTTNLLTGPMRYDSESGTMRSTYTDEDEGEVTVKVEQGFSTQLRTNQFYYVEPEESEITGVQRAWLKRYLDQLEAALYGPDFKDPEKGYAAFIDARSFIDYHILVEITKNVDGHRFSTFFTKDRGEKLKMEPVWDWNLSFGNANGKQGWLPEYWLWPQLSDTEYAWFRRLFEDPNFAQQYVDRWQELRRSALTTDRLTRLIDEFARTLNESQERNFQRWPILGKSVVPNYYFGETYAEEVDWMKDWLRKRCDWIDAQFLPQPQLAASKSADGSLEVTRAGGSGNVVVCALDGTDPRSATGQSRSTAFELRSSVVVLPGKKLIARARLEERWSAPLILIPEP